jgi:hypothetical protein
MSDRHVTMPDRHVTMPDRHVTMSDRHVTRHVYLICQMFLSNMSDMFIESALSVRCLPHLSDIYTVSGKHLLNLSDASNASVRHFYYIYQ